MNALEKLIGQQVVAYFEKDDEEGYEYVEGKVVNVDIEDYYFYEKNETIAITVSIQPLMDLPNGIDPEDLNSIPLENIRKK
ncbi:hypothetical protein HC174_01395 [Salinimicrobium sp. CDJ15-81-2]|nr:hypothetical protein [Salinimicrobium nanhaiense]